MSSVSTKSTSGTDEAIIKAREDYRNKEAELLKKHNREIRALTDKYTTELDKKDRVYSTFLGNVREKSQESLTKKDVRYQKEMEDLRRMHTKQLEKLMQDNRARLDAQVKASTSEVKQANLGKQDRIEELHSRYEGQHASQSEKYSKQLQELRDDQKAQIQSMRTEFNEAHEKELDGLRDERNEDVAKLRNDFRKLKQSSSERLKNQQVNHMGDKLRMEGAHMDSIKKEAEAHQRIQEISREGFQDALKDTKTKMVVAREDDLRTQTSLNSDFKEKVSKRIDNQVNRLERDLEKVRNQSLLEKAQVERDAKYQVDNLRNSYKTKFDYLENARRETLEQTNDIAADTTRKIVESADKQMGTNSRYYISRMETENLKNRQALDSVQKEYDLRQKYTAENSQNRVERIRQDSDLKEKALRTNFETNIGVLKATNEEEVKDIRLAILKEAEARVSNMKDQFQKQEVDHQRKLNNTINAYEKQIGEMNDQFTREKRLRDSREKRLVSEIKRSHDTEIEALKMKYEELNKQTTVAHSRELRDVTKRNHEKLDEVINAMKKT